MAETNFTIERDLTEAEAMANALVPYVYENTLYAKIGGGLNLKGAVPVLTIGALLMRIRRLDALRDQMSVSQRAQLNHIVARNDEVQDEWRLHYEGKLVEEIGSRLRSMEPYFQECREDPRLCASAYLPEALRRTIVQEILLVMDALHTDDSAVKNQVRSADTKLQSVIQPSEFLWAEILEPVYPRDSFWWLYRRPPQA